MGGNINLGTGFRVRRSGIRIKEEQEFCSFTRKALGSTQPSIQLVSGFFTIQKRSGCVANQCIIPTANVKNEWSYTTTPPMCFQGVDKENSFLGTFAKWRKVTISFVMSVRRLPLDEFP